MIPDEEKYPPEVSKAISFAKRKLSIITDEEREIIKGLLWDIYEKWGIPPKTLRAAFSEAILDIESEERKYEQLESEGEKANKEISKC